MKSLQGRLLRLAALSIAAALFLSWIVLTILFERHVERGVERALIRHGLELAATLQKAPDGTWELTVDPSDGRFEKPSSGLYWRIDGPGAALRSRSLWDETFEANKPIGDHDWTTGDVQGPFGQKLVWAGRKVTPLRSDVAVTILLGEDHARVTEARQEFSRDLGIFLALLWAILSAAAWIYVGLGLKPVSEVNAALDTLKASATARLDTAQFPSELLPLTNTINSLADAREVELTRARQRAGDLAHALKTPLAAISAETRRIDGRDASQSTAGIKAAVEAARDAIDRELVRARLAVETGPPGDVRRVVDRLIAVVSRTDFGEGKRFINALAEGPLQDLPDPHLMELIGPLIENAARFAVSEIRISGQRSVICVEDDGPGLESGGHALALRRGLRLDEQQAGHGLGLAIVQELASQFGGGLELKPSAQGGLCVCLTWP